MRPRRQKRHEDLLEKRQLLDEAGMLDALRRIAQAIVDRNRDPKMLVLVGVRTGGVFIAERLRRLIHAATGHEIPLGAMDITLYRDDVFTGLPKPEVGPTELPCSLEGRSVILVDDVLYTGRTTRAALVQLMDFGRTERVELAVLVDRGHRELPIQPDFVGITVETTREQSVRVMLHELNEPDRVVLLERVRA